MGSSKLVILPENSKTSLGAIASEGAIEGSSVYGGASAPTQAANFLMKRIRMNVGWVAAVNNETIVIALVQGTMSAGEFDNVFTRAAIAADNFESPDFTGENDSQMKQVCWETVRLLQGDMTVPLWLDISLANGKGIPFQQGTGWHWVVFNMANSSLTTGSSFELFGAYYGVWFE